MLIAVELIRRVVLLVFCTRCSIGANEHEDEMSRRSAWVRRVAAGLMYVSMLLLFCEKSKFAIFWK
jgi:hypothetical protein